MAIITLSVTAWSQGVGINETGANPNPSAILDVESSNKGFLPPRLTTSQRDAIINPADGLIIFNTTTNCLQWYIGASIWHDACAPNLYQQYPVGSNFCNVQPTAIVDVTNPVTGRTWMDRNLGATQVAQSFDDAQSYGSFFQWGRFADGHQCVNQFPNENVATSMSILTQSQTDSPQHGFFIHGFDWRTQPNNSLWQGVNGVNNPCPLGFRLPTISEWEVERNTWINVQSSGAFASLLKLPSAGFRSSNTISVAFAGAGTQGLYWSSSPDLSQNSSLVLGYNEAFPVMVGFFRAQGCSVRCIKD